MSSYSSSAAWAWALAVWALATCPSALRGEEPSAHESPAVLTAQPSVYLRPLPDVSPGAQGPSRPQQVPGLLTSTVDAPMPVSAGALAPVARRAAATTTPQPAAPTAREHEVWLVSTRRLSALPSAGSVPAFTPDVYRYTAGRGWMPASLDELMQPSPQAVTSIFVHGNDTNAEAAVSDGLGLFSQLAGGPPAQATRFIIWSWPIEMTGLRVRRSAQTNATRSGIEGYFLAGFIRRLGAVPQVSMLGYSSGAGVVTGALHVLGGGALEGGRLALPPAALQTKIDAVLLGAATPNDWLLPGRTHERALEAVNRLVVTVNSEDAVLHWYRMLWGRTGPTALGSSGVASVPALGAAQSRLVQVNLESALGRNHGWTYYTQSQQVVSLLRYELLDLPAQLVAKAVRPVNPVRTVRAP